MGVAVSPDGTAWFLSRRYGLASWKPAGANYPAIARREVPELGLPVDVAADPDGTVWLADTERVLRLDPATGGVRALPLPSGDVRRLHLDAAARPRALYVSTGRGVAIYRGP